MASVYTNAFLQTLLVDSEYVYCNRATADAEWIDIGQKCWLTIWNGVISSLQLQQAITLAQYMCQLLRATQYSKIQK